MFFLDSSHRATTSSSGRPCALFTVKLAGKIACIVRSSQCVCICIQFGIFPIIYCQDWKLTGEKLMVPFQFLLLYISFSNFTKLESSTPTLILKKIYYETKNNAKEKEILIESASPELLLITIIVVCFKISFNMYHNNK